MEASRPFRWPRSRRGRCRACRPSYHRRNPCGEERAVLEVRLDRLAREACENDVSRRVQEEDDSKLLATKRNILDLEFVGKLYSTTLGLHDPQLLAGLLRPVWPTPRCLHERPFPTLARALNFPASTSLAVMFGFTAESSASASRLQRIPRDSTLTRQERYTYVRSPSWFLRL